MPGYVTTEWISVLGAGRSIVENSDLNQKRRSGGGDFWNIRLKLDANGGSVEARARRWPRVLPLTLAPKLPHCIISALRYLLIHATPDGTAARKLL